MILSAKHRLCLTAAVMGGLTLMGVLYFRSSPKQVVPTATLAIVNQAVATQIVPKPVYVNYVSMHNSHNPKYYQRQLTMLQRTGSLTGSLDTQFKRATHAKMSYRFGRKKPTVFVPMSLTKIMPDQFILTGREYDDLMADGGAYRTVYRLFENPTNKNRIEIFESAIDTDQPLLRVKELQNEQILAIPMQLERFVGKKSLVYYRAEIIIKDRLYKINTKGVDRAELIKFIERLIMAHG